MIKGSDSEVMKCNICGKENKKKFAINVMMN